MIRPTIFGSTVGYPSDSLASCHRSICTRLLLFCRKNKVVPLCIKAVELEVLLADRCEFRNSGFFNDF